MSKEEGFIAPLRSRDFNLSDCSCPLNEKTIIAAIPKLTAFLNENLHNAREAYALVTLYRASLERIFNIHANALDVTEQVKKGPQA